MNQTQIADKTAAYLITFLDKEGFVLLKTEYVKEDGINYLRAYIDLSESEREKRKIKAEQERVSEEAAAEKPEEEPVDTGDTEDEEGEGLNEETPEPGIGINDCALVSRRLSKWLDKEDFIPEEYMLEVCSRGYLN